jgi:hypothetical protein
LYHTFGDLSRGFFNFFEIFFICSCVSLSFGYNKSIPPFTSKVNSYFAQIAGKLFFNICAICLLTFFARGGIMVNSARAHVSEPLKGEREGHLSVLLSFVHITTDTRFHPAYRDWYRGHARTA